MSRPALTRAQRSEIARIRALRQHGRGQTNTAPARAASPAGDERWLTEADPDGVLSADERKRRAARLKTAYYRELALRSSLARARSKQLATEAAAAERELREAGEVA